MSFEVCFSLSNLEFDSSNFHPVFEIYFLFSTSYSLSARNLMNFEWYIVLFSLSYSQFLMGFVIIRPIIYNFAYCEALISFRGDNLKVCVIHNYITTSTISINIQAYCTKMGRISFFFYILSLL